MPGFPIRTSSDHSSVDSSPRLIAASHVLHRLLVPRHPPCALNNLTTTRCSRPLCNSQTTARPQPTPQPPHTHDQQCKQFDDRTSDRTSRNTPRNGTQQTAALGLFRTQQRCLGHRTSRTTNPIPPDTRSRHVLSDSTSAVAGNDHHQCTATWSAHRHVRPAAGSETDSRPGVLLRKEVIQPHLPVRLPCYDFVPIASPTFDGSLPQGLGHRLRVLPTFVT